jgi:hypothetical protein
MNGESRKKPVVIPFGTKLIGFLPVSGQRFAYGFPALVGTTHARVTESG